MNYFAKGLKKHANILSKSTLDYWVEILREYNSDILSVKHLGINEDGEREMAVILQNGQYLTDDELEDMMSFAENYLPMSDINLFGNSISLKFVNIEWEYIDLEFRVQLSSNYDTDEVRKNIQTNLTKYLDFRFWDIDQKVEWDDLLSIVKRTEGVSYVADGYFSPNSDKSVPVYKLPRIRGFIMRELDGTLISDNNNVLLPIFYPTEDE